jgi:hypothetical protein
MCALGVAPDRSICAVVRSPPAWSPSPDISGVGEMHCAPRESPRVRGVWLGQEWRLRRTAYRVSIAEPSDTEQCDRAENERETRDEGRHSPRRLVAHPTRRQVPTRSEFHGPSSGAQYAGAPGENSTDERRPNPARTCGLPSIASPGPPTIVGTCANPVSTGPPPLPVGRQSTAGNSHTESMRSRPRPRELRRYRARSSRSSRQVPARVIAADPGVSVIV